jgi:RNA polymerase sigma-70 factor, ECF subfamily
MEALSTFERHRQRLFGLAYRMTGSVADANVICQDAWLRWRTVDESTICNPEAFLVRITTHLALDRARRAQVLRETYVGPYLPEPLPASDTADPERLAELSDSLTFAFLVLLDEIGPVERAVFVLHDVFSYSFNEIAEMVGKTAPACRKIASRTRKQLHDHAVELRRPSPSEERAMIDKLIGFILAGDIAGLMAICAPDIVELSDGGALRRAARRPVVGPHRVARFMVNLSKRLDPSTTTVDLVTVNGSTGILFKVHGEPDMVMTFAFAPNGQIRRIFSQHNNEKLRHFST